MVLQLEPHSRLFQFADVLIFFLPCALLSESSHGSQTLLSDLAALYESHERLHNLDPKQEEQRGRWRSYNQSIQHSLYLWGDEKFDKSVYKLNDMSGANVSHVVNLVYLELTDANTMVELWSDRCVLKWKRGEEMAGCNYCSHSVSRIRSG